MDKAEGKRKAENEDEGVKKLPRLGEEEESGDEEVQKQPRLSSDKEEENEDEEVQKQPPLGSEEATSAPKVVVPPPMTKVDSDGRYVYEIGDELTTRYQIQSKLGEGTYSQVLECWDDKEWETVAIKAPKSRDVEYRDVTKYEVFVLSKLADSAEARSRFVQIRTWFHYGQHTCIVYEKLGPSLRDLLKKNSCYPVPMDLVRIFGRQLLGAVAYLHDMKLIHTDLKPENVLLVSPEFVELPAHKRMSSDEVRFRYSPKSSAIKLIDFGSSIFDCHRIQFNLHVRVVTTRFYRAPEVILGLGWTHPCDLWSVGCILAELCTGQILFKAYEDMDFEHLAMMERVLGQLPEHMTQRASHEAQNHFREGSILNWPQGAYSMDTIRAVNTHEPLEVLVPRHVRRSESSELIDLLNGLMRYDPSTRLTARQALEHRFFTDPP